MIGRRVIPGNSTSWKRITAVTPTGGFFPAEGERSNRFDFTVDSPSVTYKSLGRLGDVTWEGEIAGRNYEDVRARAETLLLLQAMKEEEAVLFGGRIAALAAPANPAASAVDGGSLTDDQYFFKVAALTSEAMYRNRSGYLRSQAAGMKIDTPATAATLQSVVGLGAASTEVNATTATTNNTVRLTWDPVDGAFGYAIFGGLATGDANLTFIGIVTSGRADIQSGPSNTLPTNGVALSTLSDTSAQALAFDGVVTQLFAAGSGAITRNVNAPLSNAVGNQIPEIADAIQNLYDAALVEPDALVMGWPECQKIDEKISSTSGDRINIMYSGEGGVQFQRIKHYQSPVSDKQIPIIAHPNFPGGMIIGMLNEVPYQDSQVPRAWEVHAGQDWTRLDYAQTKPTHEFEVRARVALAGYFPGGQFVMHNIHEN